MPRKPNLTDALFAEVINYGGFPVTRATAYKLCLETTECRRTADMFAFRPNTRCLPDCEPLSYAEVLADMAACGTT